MTFLAMALGCAWLAALLYIACNFLCFFFFATEHIMSAVFEEDVSFLCRILIYSLMLFLLL